MNIEQMRENIDKIDDGLITLFEERMDIAAEVGRYKAEQGLPIRDASREREILFRQCERVKPEIAPYVKSLYTTIFESAANYQQRQTATDSAKSAVAALIEKTLANTPADFPARATVACQGTEGAYSQSACDKLIYPADIMYFRDFEGVFKAVSEGLCRYGILPLENSAAGSVNEVYDLMSQYRAYIVRSVKLPITHTLLAAPGAVLSDIKEITSHDQAIRQCSEFLKANPAIRVTECENTAVAAKKVAELVKSGRTDVAVIASHGCAELYGLSALSFTLQNTDNNYTRFICISKQPEIYKGAHKTSVMFALDNKPGALFNVLAKFNASGINLNKLESRPIPGLDFEFKFYFDIDTPTVSPELVQVLASLEQETSMFRYLGTYQEF